MPPAPSAAFTTNTMRRLAVLTTAASVALAGTAAVNDTLLWGAYRPGLYFGLRPRLPQSLMTGLVWFGTQDYQAFTGAFRTRCSQATALKATHRNATRVRAERQNGHVYLDRVRPQAGRRRDRKGQKK